MSRLASIRAAAASQEDDPTIEAPVAISSREELIARTGLATANQFQGDIFQHLQDQLVAYSEGRPTEGCGVEAVAGSGKTTTIVAAANLIPRHMSAIFLAFNKSIAEELKERLPKHIDSKTLNGLGYRYLRPYLSGLGLSNPNLTDGRTRAMVRKELSYEQNDAFGKDVVWLVGMCKSMGVAPLGVSDAVGINGLTATDAVLNDICLHHSRMIDVVLRPTAYATVRRVLQMSFDDKIIYSTNTIDYNDQKWLTVCKRPYGRSMIMPTYDIVIIDEVQDVNAVDIELIKMILKPNGIVIGVGDSNQAIYGFRGADTDAFDGFKKSFNAKSFPLSITYRCGKKIVAHAQELVPSIQAADSAVDADVQFFGQFDQTLFQPKDMVLCRNNAPLIAFAYRLIQAGVPTYVKGRDLGTNLIRIINDCAAVKTWVPNPKIPGKKMPEFSLVGITTLALVTELGQWKDTQVELIRAEDPDDEAAIQRLMDQYNSIMVFAHANTDNKATTVVQQIESMFSDDAREDAVVCSTIHKAKGLEADRVFMTNPECLYPQYIKEGSWQYKQEKNMDYVARTRAKLLYGYINPKLWA